MVVEDGILVDYFNVDMRCVVDAVDLRIDILSECAGCGGGGT